jgi:FtsH-binding integral membrane protein
MAVILAVGVIAVVIGAIAYVRRARLKGYLKSRGVSLRGTYDVFAISAVLSIVVVAWTAYSIMQYGHVWLGVAALVVEVELMALLDPRIHTLFGLFGTPQPKSNVVLDSLRSPGTPLLLSAYVLLFVGILSTLYIYVAGFIDRQGYLAIIDFFASYAFILVGLGVLVRYLAYRQLRAHASQT